MSSHRYNKLKTMIKPNCRGLILIHPDPDSLASAMALRLLFQKNRATAEIALSRPIKRMENRKMVKLLRIPSSIFKDLMLSSCDLFCTVDAQPNQFPELSGRHWDIVVDHHPVEEGYDCDFSDVRPKIGATSSMMVEYLEEANIRITGTLATALCYGIITDTDRFQRGMTKEDASAFSRAFPNANYELLRIIEAKEIPNRQLDFFSLALQRLKIVNFRAIIHIGAADSGDTAVILADFFVRVSGLHLVAVSCIVEERLIIVFRSMNMRRDVGKIANTHFSSLGSAGGHKFAARAEIPLKNLPQKVNTYSFDAIEQFIQKRIARPGKRPPGTPLAPQG